MEWGCSCCGGLNVLFWGVSSMAGLLQYLALLCRRGKFMKRRTTHPPNFITHSNSTLLLCPIYRRDSTYVSVHSRQEEITLLLFFSIKREHRKSTSVFWRIPEVEENLPVSELDSWMSGREAAKVASVRCCEECDIWTLRHISLCVFRHLCKTRDVTICKCRECCISCVLSWCHDRGKAS